jgi:ABC-type bacteriocin/lantibiotic exporter with double-glycine peptidase domain
MEEQKSIAQLAILGSIILIFVVVLFVGFVIVQKRKRSALNDIIEIMKVNQTKNYIEVKKDIEEIKDHLGLKKAEKSGSSS